MWLSVSIRTEAERAEALSETLLDAGARSVSIEDADAGTPEETPQFGEPCEAPASLWAHSKVIALLDADAPVASIVEAAAQAAGLATAPAFTCEEVAEQNWVQLTQSQFAPIQINERLWIVPSWHDAPDETAINIELDPGMAFGTGSHPSTRLCLDWLCEAVQPGCTVLDYGCGSGILGIAAARLGASAALGVDIDERALEAARDNAVRNGVDTTVRVQHSSAPPGDTFDFVVANILTRPLCVLAPAIAAHIAPGGLVALSGVLEQQAEQVIAAWSPWVTLAVGATREGWVRLQGQRPNGVRS